MVYLFNGTHVFFGCFCMGREHWGGKVIPTQYKCNEDEKPSSTAPMDFFNDLIF